MRQAERVVRRHPIDGVGCEHITRVEVIVGYSRRQELFLDRKFGLFIHWGLYSILGRGEWVLYNEKLPREDYASLSRKFTGDNFNADAIATLAVEAGMRYVCMTAKHHDGFCLFDSALTDYTSVKTAARRDFIKEMAEACSAHGLGFHPYYSLWDWYHPGFVPEDSDRWQQYLDYYQGQVRELCENYGPISGMWFDPGGGVGPDYDFGRTAEIIHGLQPDAAVTQWDYWVGEHTFSRLGRLDEHGRHMIRGDVARNLESVVFEVSDTINESWGYNANDTRYKSAVSLIRLLGDVVGRGGNLLLNIGPRADGSVDSESAARLREIGKWLSQNGEAIYGTRAILHPRVNAEGYTLLRDDHAYFLLRNLTPLLDRMMEEADPLETTDAVANVEFNGVRVPVKSVRPLGRTESLEFNQDGTKLTVSVPRSVLRWQHFILDAQTAGKAEVDADIRPQPDGSLICEAQWAALTTINPGEPRFYEGENRIGNWNHSNASLAWLIRVPRDGSYRIFVEQACEETAAGSPYELRIGDTAIEAVTKASASWADHIMVEVGMVDLPAGKVQVTMKPHSLKSYAFLDLKSVRLVPVEE